jgi:hypothetical protein
MRRGRGGDKKKWRMARDEGSAPGCNRADERAFFGYPQRVLPTAGRLGLLSRDSAEPAHSRTPRFEWTVRRTSIPELRRYVVSWTHCRRQEGASKGSAKYWVSWATFPFWNSMMLTVYARCPL